MPTEANLRSRSSAAPIPVNKKARVVKRKPAVERLAEFEADRNFVLSFARGLEVIQSFYNESHGLTAARIAKKTGLSRAAVRRFLITLQLLGYADNVAGVYHLRPSVLKLACSYLTSTSLPSQAQPILEQVSSIVHESTSLSALDDDSIIYLARHTSSRVLSVGLSVGSRLPAYCTSMGRVLLAGLPSASLNRYFARVELKRWTNKTVTSKAGLLGILEQVRHDGYALVDGELEPGLRSIAVPVRNFQQTVAAMNVGAHVSSVSVDDMRRRILPVLLEHADMLSRTLR